jgi:MFS family permease
MERVEDVAGVRRLFADRDVYYGWVVVGTCFVGAMLVYGLINSFGVFLGHIVDAFGLSHARASTVFAVQTGVIYGGSALLGLLVDRYSIRRLYFVGAVLLGAGLFGASQAGSVLALTLWYGVVGGAGAALVIIISYVTPPRWFRERRGLATGIAASGAGVGTLVIPPLSAFLIDAVGWQNAYLALATGAVAVLLVAATLVAKTPETLTGGTRTDRDEDRDEDRPSLREQVGDAAGTVRSGAFLLVLLGFGAVYAPSFAVSAHVVEYTASVDLGRTVGVVALSAIGVADVAGKFSVGYVSDRVQTRRVHVVALCAAALGAVTISLTISPTAVTVLALAAAFGLSRGGVGALMTPVLADLFGSDNLNTLYGVASLGLAVTGATVPFLVGLGYDLTGTFQLGLAGVGALSLLAAAAFVAAAAANDE